MDDIVNYAAVAVALLAEIAAILIILLGLIKTAVFCLRSAFPYKFDRETFLEIRMQLGGSLSLSLEFLIGADILKTAISPTWNDLGMLGAIVLIRTLLNYFLSQELKEI